MDEIKAGDRVRSYDFPDDKSCFVEGVVEQILPRGEVHTPTGAHFYDCDRYVIRASRKFRGNEALPRNDYCFPPVNGIPTTRGRITDGVEKVEVASERTKHRRTIRALLDWARSTNAPADLVREAEQVLKD